MNIFSYITWLKQYNQVQFYNKGETMIELKNLTYTVEDSNASKDILKNINIQFKSGIITVVTGHNGSGKSTLAKLIMGLILPTSGEILYNGKNITNLSVTERANLGITLAFQQPVKFKGLTVKDLIDVATKQNTNISKACDYLSQVGLCAKDYLNRPLDSTLSGGELKRIELAIALSKGGDTYIFDEPEAGIDLWSFDELINVFKALKGKTVIIVSHQQKILDFADEILLLNSDKQYELGSKNEMLQKIAYNSCNKLKENIN